MINLNEGFTPTKELPAFIAGQVVYHLNYGYRGSSIDTDPSCRKPGCLVSVNKPSPTETSPGTTYWSTVLMKLYVAQSNLK